MSELTGKVYQLTHYLNQVFPTASLFLVASEADVKRLFMQLTENLLASSLYRTITAARVIGMNTPSSPTSSVHSEPVWVFSPDILMSRTGDLIAPEHAEVLWLERPAKGSGNILLNHSLACSIVTPLDNGESLANLFRAIQDFMPENFVSTAATVAACIMAASYEDVIKHFGCIAVPILFGEPGSCKSEALRCGLSLFGAQKTHLLNNQTTPSFLFDALKQTTIPLGVDDITEKAHESWEELVVDAYNNTPRGTRSYNTEGFRSLPIPTANWKFSSRNERAHTRVINIPFFEHTNEPDAGALYASLNVARTNASKSVGQVVKICSSFAAQALTFSEANSDRITNILTGSHVRFTTTVTIFMYFFMEVSKLTGGLLTEEQCWEFLDSHMAPLAICQADAPRTPDEGLGKQFLETLSTHAGTLNHRKLQQCVMVDHSTRGNLGKCIVIRTAEVMTLLHGARVNMPDASKDRIETSLLASDYCRRSHQRFPGSAGGQRCLIMQQAQVSEETVQRLRIALNDAPDNESFVSAQSTPQESAAESNDHSPPKRVCLAEESHET